MKHEMKMYKWYNGLRIYHKPKSLVKIEALEFQLNKLQSHVEKMKHTIELWYELVEILSIAKNMVNTKYIEEPMFKPVIHPIRISFDDPLEHWRKYEKYFTSRS